jgi:radical SAM protein with 4Fe4S-binding SPASM domain
MSPGLIDRLFVPRLRQARKPIHPGLYHFTDAQDDRVTRFHLRVDDDGAGLLIANATAAAWLSASGAVIGKGLLEGHSEAQLLAELNAHFRDIPNDRQLDDIRQVQDLLRSLVDPGGHYPVFNLEDPSLSPIQAHLAPPIEATVPLADPRQLVQVLDRLWDAGIPHVTILTPPAPNPEWLLAAVQRAQSLGLISGLSGRASDLAGGTLLDGLIAMGLDHLTLYYASADPTLHDTIFGAGDHAAAEALFGRDEAAQLASVGHLPLVQATLRGVEATLARLRALSAPFVKFFAIASAGDPTDGSIPAHAMPQMASSIEDAADSAHVHYQWEPPVLRNPSRPLFEQIRTGPRCASDLAVRIEADGSVIPPRGPWRVAGNAIQTDWPSIWRSDAFRSYRQRVESPTRCDICPGLAICAADCPREPAGWSTS